VRGLLVGCIGLFTIETSLAALNVQGADLQLCSTPGTALTGFTRDGHCTDFGDDDAGSHHICIQMKPDFCKVTGQPNWCGEKMECMGQSGQCSIGNWCVCQWAFARYIQMAGGCDAIVNIECASTNMAALKAYRSNAGKDPVIKKALDCLEKRCNLPVVTQKLYDSEVPQLRKPETTDTSDKALNLALFAFFCAAVSLSAWSLVPRRQPVPTDTEVVE